MRILLPVGEKLTPETAQLLFKYYPRITIFTTYGMTEFAGIIFVNKITAQSDLNRVSEGRTPANSQVYVLDRNLQPLPVGMPGDVYFSGDSLGPGYFNDEKKTKAVFLPHPFFKNKTLFKTGDIGKMHPDGSWRSWAVPIFRSRSEATASNSATSKRT